MSKDPHGQPGRTHSASAEGARLRQLYSEADAALRDGRLGDAFRTYRLIAELDPQSVGALRAAAALAAQIGAIEDGRDLIERALEATQHDPELYCVAGLLSKKSGDLDGAVDWYHKALTVKPDFAPACFNIGNARLAQGRPQDAIEHFRRALQADPCYFKALANLCELLLQSQQPAEVIDLCRRFMHANPATEAVHPYLARAFGLSGQIDRAIAHYRQALAHNPGAADLHVELGLIFQGRQDFEAAQQCYRAALKAVPKHVRANHALGTLLHATGRLRDAAAHYEAVLAADGGAHLSTRYNLADVYENLNRLDEAEAVVRKALDIDPHHPFVNRVAATLLRRRGKAREALDLLNGIEIPERHGYGFHFELGRIYDRLDDADAALRCFLEGKRQLQKTYATDAGSNDKGGYLEKIAALERRFDADWVASWTPPPDPTAGQKPTPVFLIGFPRSGTTLLDQILDSHGEIQVMEEQPILARVREAVEQLPSGYPDALATLSETEIGKLRALYFAEAVKVIGGQLPSILVDKLPLNIVHVGLIHRIFPQAKLILALRHPCDVCLSCVMQQFALNDAMANFHTLEDAAQLYARAFGLWERYASLLPLNYHVVKYESLVEDVEGETRALLAFLGVESRADTENFWEHAQKRDAINTPSYHQVSQPIYRSARYRWTRYRRHLEPAMAHLGPYLKQFGYEGG